MDPAPLGIVFSSSSAFCRSWTDSPGDNATTHTTRSNLIALLQGHSTLVGQLQLDPYTDTLLTGGSDGRVIVFSLESYRPVHVLEAHSTSVTCLQFDKRFIVTGGNDGRIKLWGESFVFSYGFLLSDGAELCATTDLPPLRAKYRLPHGRLHPRFVRPLDRDLARRHPRRQDGDPLASGRVCPDPRRPTPPRRKDHA